MIIIIISDYYFIKISIFLQKSTLLQAGKLYNRKCTYAFIARFENANGYQIEGSFVEERAGKDAQSKGGCAFQ